MVIDFHTHCFPDKIADKAIAKLAYASGGLQPYTDGTLGGLRQSMAKDGVDLSVVMSIATNAHQQTSVNDFAAAINNGTDIIAFGSVYPHSEDAFDELERIKALGLKGVKLHPDYQGFAVDDLKMKPLYRKISELGLITLFHAGADVGFAPPYGGMPENMKTAVSWFDTPVVAAHWGGMGCGDGVVRHLPRLRDDAALLCRSHPREARHGQDAVRHGYAVALPRAGMATTGHARTFRRRARSHRLRQREKIVRYIETDIPEAITSGMSFVIYHNVYCLRKRALYSAIFFAPLTFGCRPSTRSRPFVFLIS